MDFAGSYKKKGMGLDYQDKRTLRVKRRSIDQRLQRDETYMKQRDLKSLTPLKENASENIPQNLGRLKTRSRQAKPTVAAVKTASEGSMTRREVLQKWKQEKELKKKLAMEKEKPKPMFKICKVKEEKAPTSLSVGKSPASRKPQVQKAIVQPQRRVTRASSAISTSKPVNSISKSVNPVATQTKRAIRQSSRLAARNQDQKENRVVTAPAKAKSVNTHKVVKSSLPKTKPPAKESVPKVKLPGLNSTQNVTSERGTSFQVNELQQSFAPPHFTFNFHFEPLSPASTQSFLFPGTALRKGRCSTPMSSRRRKRDTSPQPLEISAIQSPKKSFHQAESPESTRREDTSQRSLETSASQSPEKPILVAPPPENSTKDVPYFRNLLATETAKLNNLCNKWKALKEDSTLSEDVTGEICCTIGKAQLLIDQRFKQFSGLVDNCEFGLGEKKTHSSDLMGFWEMIYFQVEDVLQMFAALDDLQANNWVRKETKQTSTKPKKILKKAKPAVKSQASKDREAARERLAAVKAAMKARQTRAQAAEQVVFEGGFFKVESPVHRPAPHCEAASARNTIPTPTIGSGSSTPRIQGYTPKNARSFIQGKLCGPLSKLVLGEVATPKSKVTTPLNKMATPISRATPSNKVRTPKETISSPLENTAMLDRTASPKDMAVASTTQENEEENPLFKYLQPSFSSMNDQLEGATVIEGKRRRSRSGILLPGLNGPQLLGTPIAGGKMFASDVFTPPSLSAASLATPTVSDDLICFDSPVPVHTVLRQAPVSQAAIKPVQPIDLLSQDVIIPSVRRSTRLRHLSACSPVEPTKNL